MDFLTFASARAPAAGDALGALKRIDLRDGAAPAMVSGNRKLQMPGATVSAALAMRACTCGPALHLYRAEINRTTTFNTS